MGDILSGISILVAIIAQALSFFYSEIIESLNEELPNKEKKQERAKFKERLIKLAWFKAFPTFIAFFTLFYLCLPTSLGIIRDSKLDFWNFVVADTLFVLIEFSCLIFVIITGALMARLFKKTISPL